MVDKNDNIFDQLIIPEFAKNINNNFDYKKNSILMFLNLLKNKFTYTDDLIKLNKQLLEFEKNEKNNSFNKILLMPYWFNKYKFNDYVRNLDERAITLTYDYEENNIILFFETFTYQCPIVGVHDFKNKTFKPNHKKK